MSLEALLVLLERPPPAGAVPLVGVNCLRLAGRALVSGGSEAGEVDIVGAQVESNEGVRTTVFQRLPEIQVGGQEMGVTCRGVFQWGLGTGVLNLSLEVSQLLKKKA